MRRRVRRQPSPKGTPLTIARALIRRGKHAEGLAILERHFDDDRWGNEAVDAAVIPVRRVHGVEAALPYWVERLGHARSVPRAHRASPRSLVRTRVTANRIKLVIVSHNWNFLACELEALQNDPRFVVRTVWPGWYVTDNVSGLRESSKSSALSRAAKDHAAALRWADVVFCDWCERPAVWLAACLPRGAALCVRLHSHEAHSPFPLLLDWHRVSEAIFGADHIREYVDGQLHVSRRVRTSVIAPVYRVADFEGAKRPEARWTLGMIGYNSANKHPLMALEILSRLRRLDRRWRLRLIGHSFSQTSRAEFDEGYVQSFWSAVRSWDLSEAVMVSPYTKDLRRWLTRVGFILSTSERESSHLGVAQGMSSGAIPVVRRWPVFRALRAAERSYPSAIHFDHPQEAAAAIEALSRRLDGDLAFQSYGRRFSDEARQRFDYSVGIPRLVAALRRAAGVPR
jgi:hypothetical protein